METILRLKVNEFNNRFLEIIKALVKDKNTVITVKIETKQDETEYLLSSAKNRKALEESIKSKEGYVFTLDEFKLLNKNLLKGKNNDLSKLKKEKISS